MNEHHIVLFEDVSLAAIRTSDNGWEVVLEFENMSDGRPCGKIMASKVMLLNYHNTFTEADDAFPTYVAEVSAERVRITEALSALDSLGYNFLARENEPFGQRLNVSHLRVASGEVSVDIVCQDYAVEKAKTDG